MGCGASSTNGPLAGPSGSGVAAVRGLRQKEPIIANNDAPGLNMADAKVASKIMREDLADDETTACGESIIGDTNSMIGDDNMTGYRRRSSSIPGSKEVSMSDVCIKQKACFAFLQSAKSGLLAQALEKSKADREKEILARTKLMLCKGLVDSARTGGLAAALSQQKK
jgi:hypothetical protein